MSATAAATEPSKVLLARTYEDGRPVLYKALMDKLPAAAAREKLPWLTIIEWQYDGSENNGMPPESETIRMATLEDALSSAGAGRVLAPRLQPHRKRSERARLLRERSGHIHRSVQRCLGRPPALSDRDYVP